MYCVGSKSCWLALPLRATGPTFCAAAPVSCPASVVATSAWSVKNSLSIVVFLALIYSCLLSSITQTQLLILGFGCWERPSSALGVGPNFLCYYSKYVLICQ